MWKTVFLTLILLIAAVLLIAETSFANPGIEGNTWVADTTLNATKPEVTPSPELPKANDQATSNQQPKDRKTENQNTAPEKQPAVNTVRPQAANPYDIDAIEKYNQENYGAGN
ncbi:MAG: hypothetical protein RMY34_00635 [Aulosira sp. DedQUE10]|nr:hypothetical protein [Aulosira sp. DedQUE10]